LQEIERSYHRLVEFEKWAAAQRTLASEIDRWAPIIKAADEYAD
jgi:hypothetical protein